MSTLKRAIFAASLCLAMTAGAASGETPNFGKPIDEARVAPWDISILPDGTGLPKGSGTPAQGAPIFAEKCSGCHGENGKGGEAAAVISDRELIGPNDVMDAQTLPKVKMPFRDNFILRFPDRI